MSRSCKQLRRKQPKMPCGAVLRDYNARHFLRLTLPILAPGRFHALRVALRNATRRSPALASRSGRAAPLLPIMTPKPFSAGAPMQERIAYQGITFDDVLLEPAFSEVLPRDVDVRSQLTRNIKINIPIV